MNRHDFMSILKKRLSGLPYDEVKEAVDYYEQYFDDAGEENEQAVIAELGSPDNIASQIIAGFAVKSADNVKSAKQGVSIVWIVILAVFASPVALPLALAVVAIALAFVVTIMAVVLSVGVAGLGLLLSGITCAVVSIPVFIQSFATGLFILGIGLLAFGIGAALLLVTVFLSKNCFNWLAKSIGGFILRRSEK